MEAVTVYLRKASNAEDGYALFLDKEGSAPPRAERGLGSSFEQAWAVELQSHEKPDLHSVDWDAVLDRVIEAYDLNDPVITDFEWPLRQAA